MDIGRMYEFVNYVANKEQSGAISPDEFNLSIEVVNIQMLNFQVGIEESYRPGDPIPRVAYQNSHKITENVKGLIYENKILKNANDRFTLPDDYYFASSLYYLLKENQDCDGPYVAERYIPILTDTEYNRRRSSIILAPDYFFPVSRYIRGEIQVAPKEISEINLTWIKIPATPFRAYIGADVYDLAGSTQWEWPDDIQIKMIPRILKYYGINIEDDRLYQHMMQEQLIGQ